jgi:hypothetical protein
VIAARLVAAGVLAIELMLAPRPQEEALIQATEIRDEEDASYSSFEPEIELAEDADELADSLDAAVDAGDGGSEPADVARPLRWTDADVRAALSGQPVMTRRIIFCETGRSGTYDPYAVGSRGEVGPAQLLPGLGNGLAIFYRWGFTEPNNPYEAVAFVNRVQAEGLLGSQYPRTSRGCVGSP